METYKLVLRQSGIGAAAGLALGLAVGVPVENRDTGAEIHELNQQLGVATDEYDEYAGAVHLEKAEVVSDELSERRNAVAELQAEVAEAQDAQNYSVGEMAYLGLLGAAAGFAVGTMVGIKRSEKQTKSENDAFTQRFAEVLQGNEVQLAEAERRQELLDQQVNSDQL